MSSCTIDVAIDCKPGHFIYMYLDDTIHFSCENCYRDRYCPSGRGVKISQNGCTVTDGGSQCEQDYYASVQGAVSCTSTSTSHCPAGSGMINGYSGCYPCGAGMYQDGSSNECSFCPQNEVSTSFSSQCGTTCEYGSMASPLIGGDGECSECQNGYYEYNGQTYMCVKCPSTIPHDPPPDGLSCIIPSTTCSMGEYLSLNAYGNEYCRQCGANNFCDGKAIAYYGDNGNSNPIAGSAGTPWYCRLHVLTSRSDIYFLSSC